MKKVNIFAILSLVAIVAGYVISSFVKGMETILLVNLIAAIVATVLAIAAIVYAAKIEKTKAFGIILLIIGILGTLLFTLLYVFVGMVKDPKNTEDICKQVVRCKADSSDVSTCYIKEDENKLLPIKCYSTNLNSDQYE